MNATIENARLWLLTKADADDERAAVLEVREPFLAKLLREDADAARKVAQTLTNEAP